MNGLLCRFFIEVRKLSGNNFEPDSLSTVHKSLQRYLVANNYPANILQDMIFDKSRQALAAKRKELTKLGYGNKPNATRELNEEEVYLLFKEGYFGKETPQSLLNAMWWFCSLHFGCRARHEARRLCWGDIALKFDETLQTEFLEWEKKRGSKTLIGKEHKTKHGVSPIVYATGVENCPISLYKEFRDRRPVEGCTAETPFFLLIEHRATPTDKVWYKNRPMGHNKIGEILTIARRKFGFEGKVTYNHSVGKTSTSHSHKSMLEGAYFRDCTFNFGVEFGVK